jgi:hypothetical protein
MRIGKKLIKRKPKNGATPQEFYFGAGTQQAIVEYKDELDFKKRNQLYVNDILPAFNKLVENLINVYGFQIQYESKIDLQNECVEFLYGVITKFDATKGAKAFSYFNVVAKNWLIIKSKQSVRNLHVFTSIDDTDSLSQHDLEIIENYSIAPSPEDVMTKGNDSEKLKYVLDRVSALAVTENEALCLKGINLLFSNINDLDFLNKRAIMLYLREITSLNPKQLSVVLSTLKRYYKTAKHCDDQDTIIVS